MVAPPAFFRSFVSNDSDSFGSSETDLFASSSYSTNGYNATTDRYNITKPTKGGTFRINDGGFYYVGLNLVFTGNGDYRSRIKFYKNTEAQYSANVGFDYDDYGTTGTQNSFYTVISASAGDYLRFTSERTNGTAANGIKAGSSVLIKKIEDDFISITRKTDEGTYDSNEPRSVFTSGSLNTDYVVISGSTGLGYDSGSGGTISINETGSYLAFINYIVSGSNTGDMFSVSSFEANLGAWFPLVTSNQPLNLSSQPSTITTLESSIIEPSLVGSLPLQARTALEIQDPIDGGVAFKALQGSSLIYYKTPELSQVGRIYSFERNTGINSNVFSGNTTYNLLSTSSINGAYSGSTLSDPIRSGEPSVAENPYNINFNLDAGAITFTTGGYYHLVYNGNVGNTSTVNPVDIRFAVSAYNTSSNSFNLSNSFFDQTIRVLPNTNYASKLLIDTIISASSGSSISIAARRTSGNTSYVYGYNSFWIYRIDNYISGLDSDNDGLLDSIENSIGSSISGSDSDGDGLSDAEEYFGYHPVTGLPTYTSSPILTDTDGGGVSDYDEILAGNLNPNNIADDYSFYDSGSSTTLVGNNYIINTYSKSNQHWRNVEQIPFGIQVPGPLSLRGRTDIAIKK